jgi:hypothetical protein
LFIKVTLNDDSTNSYKLTPRVIVAFEQQFGKGLPKLIGGEQRIEHVYWLAWKSMQVAGLVVKPWPDFLDTIKSAELDADPSSESTAKA